MASVYHLCHDAVNIKEAVVNKYSDFADSNKKLFFSSVRIQKTWRGYTLRKEIKNWNEKATTIQRHVRGWLLRLHLPEILQKHYEEMARLYYHQQATKIQALWRGYKVRKVIVSVKELVAGRAEVNLITNEMQSYMKDIFKTMQEELQNTLKNQQKLCMKKSLMALFDRHHLLRTKQQEGVLSKHGSDELSNLEKILKSVKWVDYMTKYRKALKAEKGSSRELSIPSPVAKKFDLNTKLRPKPYERMLMTQN